MFGTSESASARLSQTAIERFWGKVCPEPNTGCWLWTGAWIQPYRWGACGVKIYDGSQGGYGRFSFSSQLGVGYAHRFSYELHFGPIPNGLQIDHKCKQHLCVNPDHLEAVSQRENQLRGSGMAAQRAARTHCPQGHEYTPTNTYRSSRNQRYCLACKRQRDKARNRGRRRAG